jgi:hypothetical protein
MFRPLVRPDRLLLHHRERGRYNFRPYDSAMTTSFTLRGSYLARAGRIAVGFFFAGDLMLIGLSQFHLAVSDLPANILSGIAKP